MTMTDIEVVESFNNAWRAMCRQYRENPNLETQTALNMLGKIIGMVDSEVKKSHINRQITIDEWLSMLDGGEEGR